MIRSCGGAYGQVFALVLFLEEPGGLLVQIGQLAATAISTMAKMRWFSGRGRAYVVRLSNHQRLVQLLLLRLLVLNQVHGESLVLILLLLNILVSL